MSRKWLTKLKLLEISLAQNDRTYALLKKLVWAYIVLWVFEGALRKWVLPGLSTPLLIVRDPIAFLIMFLALEQGISFINNYVRMAWLATLLSFSITLSFGHQNVFAALYGARIMILHFPLIFIIARIFTKQDVIEVGKFLIYLAPFMTILIYLQFNSPQSAWVNRGVGGNIDGAGFAGAMGYLRPPGTFSFTSGLASFYPLTTVFICYFWIAKIKIKRYLLIAATIALMIALPLTISRTAVLWSSLIIGFAILTGMGNSKLFLPVIYTTILLAITLVFISNLSFFQTGIEVFMARFEKANENQGGVQNSILSRILGMLTGPLDNLGDLNLFDGKLGMGSNAGARLLGNESRLQISEGELGRIFKERGLILGLIVYLIRTTLVLNFITHASKAYRQQKILACLFIPILIFTVYVGQWSVASKLGFSIICCGLAFASLNEKK